MKRLSLAVAVLAVLIIAAGCWLKYAIGALR